MIKAHMSCLALKVVPRTKIGKTTAVGPGEGDTRNLDDNSRTRTLIGLPGKILGDCAMPNAVREPALATLYLIYRFL